MGLASLLQLDPPDEDDFPVAQYLVAEGVPDPVPLLRGDGRPRNGQCGSEAGPAVGPPRLDEEPSQSGGGGLRKGFDGGPPDFASGAFGAGLRCYEVPHVGDCPAGVDAHGAVCHQRQPARAVLCIFHGYLSVAQTVTLKYRKNRVNFTRNSSKNYTGNYIK